MPGDRARSPVIAVAEQNRLAGTSGNRLASARQPRRLSAIGGGVRLGRQPWIGGR
jgi:hypothetical protein